MISKSSKNYRTIQFCTKHDVLSLLLGGMETNAREVDIIRFVSISNSKQLSGSTKSTFAELVVVANFPKKYMTIHFCTEQVILSLLLGGLKQNHSELNSCVDPLRFRSRKLISVTAEIVEGFMTSKYLRTLCFCTETSQRSVVLEELNQIDLTPLGSSVF